MKKSTVIMMIFIACSTQTMKTASKSESISMEPKPTRINQQDQVAVANNNTSYTLEVEFPKVAANKASTLTRGYTITLKPGQVSNDVKLPWKETMTIMATNKYTNAKIQQLVKRVFQADTLFEVNISNGKMTVTPMSDEQVAKSGRYQ